MTPTKDRALVLMSHSMPPFENFLSHCASLKSECERANALTPERSALFDEYEKALVAARDDYENQIVELICAELDADEVESLIEFFNGPAFKALTKSQALGGRVAEIASAWQTKVLESCPDTWKMLVAEVGKWQTANTPPDSTTILPESPNGNGWTRISDIGKPAEELVMDTTTEEAEMAAMRSDPPEAA